jgi:hypothetical protein
MWSRRLDFLHFEGDPLPRDYRMKICGMAIKTATLMSTVDPSEPVGSIKGGRVFGDTKPPIPPNLDELNIE